MQSAARFFAINVFLNFQRSQFYPQTLVADVYLLLFNLVNDVLSHQMEYRVHIL